MTTNELPLPRELMITYDIDDPADARVYIKTWAPRLLGRIADHVQTNQRIVYFATMTDDEACMVARLLWRMEQRGRRGKG